MAAQRYLVVNGVNYPSEGKEKRADPGDIVADLPGDSVPWLLEQGLIEPVEED